MDPKRIFMAGAMAFAITFGTILCNEEANAGTAVVPQDKAGAQGKSASAESQGQQMIEADPLHSALGVSSDEELYHALYNGNTLADIARSNNKDVQSVIELQVSELTEQLDKRLLAGSITPSAYQAQIAELNDIVAKSVYGYA